MWLFDVQLAARKAAKAAEEAEKAKQQVAEQFGSFFHTRKPTDCFSYLLHCKLKSLISVNILCVRFESLFSIMIKKFLK